jgi:fatty acid desaturase
MAITTTAVLDPIDALLDEAVLGAKDRASDFAQLSAQINAAGLMKRRPGYYVAKVSLTVAFYIACWVVFAFVGASWWQLAVGAVLAFATTQVAFLGHDFGHRQIFRTRRPSEIAGLLLGNLGVGMSYGWWMSKHTRHHANPNHEDQDPDVGAGALVWTPEQARTRKGIGKIWARYQAYIFFPLLTLEGLSLHVAGVQEIIKTPMRNRKWEGVLIGLHIVAYLTAIFATLPVGMAFAFIGIHQALFGFYMGCSFAPNHKGMPMMTKEDELDYLRKQVITSRNVAGGPLTDFMLGGLNYQIEHHLFPSMPRANLHKSQPIVEKFCREHDVSYLQSGVYDSYAMAISYLNDVGKATMTPAPLTQELLTQESK